jgi:hypothetical protein
MSTVHTYAVNIDSCEIDLLDEITYGTITVLYPNKSYFQKIFGIKIKPIDILFCFDSYKYVLEKKSINKLKYFNFTQINSSPTPTIIKNNSSDKIFLKVTPAIKHETDDMKLNYILSNLEILKFHPSLPNITYSIYNCIYRLYNLNNIYPVKHIIELACIYNGKDSNRFIFAYNNNEIKKEEISYLLLKILCNNF